MNNRVAKMKSNFICPFCRGAIYEQQSGWRCSACNKEFSVKNDQIYFETITLSEEQKDLNKVRDWFKQWPWFYSFILDFFGPVWWGGLDIPDFLKIFPTEGTTVVLGSGHSRVAEDVINVDLFPYAAVDIVADVGRLPFKDGSVQRIISDNVLEHVPEPALALQEMHRVLSTDGVVYVRLPFLYPFHASPYDYTRWTNPGFLHLVDKQFSVVKEGVVSGIFSTLTSFLCYLFATIFSFGNRTLYWILVNFSTFIFFPIKFLDIFANHLPNARDTAAGLYYVLRKK